MQSARLVVATVVFVAFAGLVTTPAVADLISASTAYQKGDYAKAFRDFRELAELGQPTAQFNLAVMYAKGQGVRQSEIYAYAWASLAAENGLEKAEHMADGLRPGIAPGYIRTIGSRWPVAQRVCIGPRGAVADSVHHVLPICDGGCCRLLQAGRVRGRDARSRKSRRSESADAVWHALGRIAPAQQAAQPSATMVSQISPGGYAGGPVPGGL